MDVLSPMFQLALAGLMAEFQQRLKTSTNPALQWITTHSALMNKVVSALLAVLATIGISSTWVVDPVTGLATFALAGIPATFAAWAKVATIAFSQYWAQKGWYRLLIRQPQELGITA